MAQNNFGNFTQENMKNCNQQLALDRASMDGNANGDRYGDNAQTTSIPQNTPSSNRSSHSHPPQSTQSSSSFDSTPPHAAYGHAAHARQTKPILMPPKDTQTAPVSNPSNFPPNYVSKMQRYHSKLQQCQDDDDEDVIMTQDAFKEQSPFIESWMIFDGATDKQNTPLFDGAVNTQKTNGSAKTAAISKTNELGRGDISNLGSASGLAHSKTTTLNYEQHGDNVYGDVNDQYYHQQQRQSDYTPPQHDDHKYANNDPQDFDLNTAGNKTQFGQVAGAYGGGYNSGQRGYGGYGGSKGKTGNKQTPIDTPDNNTASRSTPYRKVSHYHPYSKSESNKPSTSPDPKLEPINAPDLKFDTISEEGFVLISRAIKVIQSNVKKNVPRLALTKFFIGKGMSMKQIDIAFEQFALLRRINNGKK